MTDEIITFGEPIVEGGGDETTYLWLTPENEPILRVTMEDTHEKDGAIYADITCWYLLDQPIGVRPVQPTTTLKLNSSHSTGWRSIPRELSKRLPGIDIEGAMTIAVYEEMQTFKQGEPMTLLGREEVSDERPFVLDPFISNGGTTVLYGEGGLSKSLVALALSISVSTGVPIFGNEPYVIGPVVYFDYEDDSRAHNVRMQAICATFGIDPEKVQVYHHPLHAKVSTAIREMRKKMDSVGAVLGVLDSVGMGRGGNAVAAEDTIRMFRALRSTNRPFLAIDHVSKEAKGKGGDQDAYGSIYTMNSARLAWYLTRSHDPDPDTIMMHAKNTKANHVRIQKPRFIQVKYVNNDNGVPTHIHIEVSDDFGMVRESVSVHQRMMMLLGQGPLTIEQMAEELGVDRNRVDTTLARDAKKEPPTFQKDKSQKPMQIRLTDGMTDSDDRLTDEGESQ